MSVKEKIKRKEDAELLLCPFAQLKDMCKSILCMGWDGTDDEYGYCVLITDR